MLVNYSYLLQWVTKRRDNSHHIIKRLIASKLHFPFFFVIIGLVLALYCLFQGFLTASCGSHRTFRDLASFLFLNLFFALFFFFNPLSLYPGGCEAEGGKRKQARRPTDKSCLFFFFQTLNNRTERQKGASCNSYRVVGFV